MKIYFLRHEKRYSSITFFTPLKKEGKKNALKLGKKLKTLNITKIYSSPFLRTLQTIEPFLKLTDIKVNLEHSIRETNIYKVIPEFEKHITLPEELYHQFKINSEYESFLPKEKINYPEKGNHIIERFNNFLFYLIKKYSDTEENILLVSHAGLINNFIDKMKRKNNLLGKIKRNSYPAGKITLIVRDNELSFEPINWSLKNIL